MEVEIPPKRRPMQMIKIKRLILSEIIDLVINVLPMNNHQKLGDILVRQQNVQMKQNARHRRFRPNRSASGPVKVPNSTLAPNPTIYL